MTHDLAYPMDPFFCDFFEVASAFPHDLSLSLVRTLVCFAAATRLLDFEPTSTLFQYYFRIDKSFGCLQCKNQNRGVKMLFEPSHKMSSWADKVLVVERRRGGTFAIPAQKIKTLPAIATLMIVIGRCCLPWKYSSESRENLKLDNTSSRL